MLSNIDKLHDSHNHTSTQFSNNVTEKDSSALNEIFSELHTSLQSTDSDPNFSTAISLPDGKTQLKSDGSGTQIKEDGICISPTPGFVIKTKRASKNDQTSKFFINACSSNTIDQPMTKKALDSNGKETEGLNVPVAVGPLRQCSDRSGRICQVVDCVVHPQVIQDCQDNIADPNGSGTFRHFLCELLIQYVSSKYNDLGGLDKRYKLPKLMYQGYEDKQTGKQADKSSAHAEVCKQWVKDTTKRPRIEEVSIPSSKTISSTKIANAKRKSLPNKTKKLSNVSIDVYIESTHGQLKSLNQFVEAIQYQTFKRTNNYADLDSKALIEEKKIQIPFLCDLPLRVQFDEEPEFQPAKLHLKSNLPSILESSIQVHISAVMCTITVIDLFEPTDHIFPFPILSKSARCEFDTRTGILTIAANFARNINMNKDTDPGSQAWKLNHALSNSSNELKSTMKKNERLLSNDCNRTLDEIDSSSNKTEWFNDKMKMKENKSICNAFKYFLLDSPLSSEAESSAKEDSADEVIELPEDRFHSQDIMSRYMLDQQEKEREDKVNKTKDISSTEEHEINYLDTDDFGPDGKYQERLKFDGSSRTEKEILDLNKTDSANKNERDWSVINIMQGEKCNFDFSNKLWATLLI